MIPETKICLNGEAAWVLSNGLDGWHNDHPKIRPVKPQVKPRKLVRALIKGPHCVSIKA